MRNAATGWVRSLAIGVSGLWVVALLALTAGPVTAAVTSLTVTTTYPAVQADPGGQVELPISVQTPTPQKVDLSVNNLPEGFKATFRGGGFIVSSVFTSGNDASPAPGDLKLRVEVPDNAEAKDYDLTVHATAGGQTADLPITLHVASVEGQGVSLTTAAPAKIGSIGQATTFSLTLNNDTAADLNFSVTVPDAPPNWVVTAKPSNDADPNNFPVAGGDTETITVSAEAPLNVAAGDFQFTVIASAGDRTAELPLAIRLSGSEEVAISSKDGTLNTQASAGTAKAFIVVVENTGSAPLADVSVTAEAPTGWTVTFSPETVSALQPQTQQEVTANILPPSNAVAGDYVVTITAEGGTAEPDEINIRTTVETSTLWGYVGIALIVLVVIGLLLVFRRYGRR